MSLLTREQMLEVNDLDLQEVDVPEWGGHVMIRPFTIADREKFEGWGDKSKGARGKRTGNELLCQMVASSIVNAKGELVFSDEDMLLLKKKNAGVIDALAKKIQAINGLAEEEEEGN